MEDKGWRSHDAPIADRATRNNDNEGLTVLVRPCEQTGVNV